MVEWHSLSAISAVDRLVTRQKGLTDDEVAQRVSKYGKNVSAKEKPVTLFAIFLRQFKSFFVYVLLGAAILSFFIGDVIEFYVIAGIVLFIVLLSFFEEFKATREMESLRKLTPKMSLVMRNGKQVKLASEELVPGDILLLSRGDLVPADARVIESANLQADESALTGESLPITKIVDELPLQTPLAERKNMVFAGGQITNGHGVALVVHTGQKTELGSIASMVGDAGEELSPLQKRLDKLGKQFSIAIFVICTLIIVIGLLRGDDINHLLLLAVAVGVSGIPESLPAVVGVALAIGMKRMAKKNAVIKRLAAVETLGTCSVICSDKTGTLTQNKMVIENIWTFGTEIAVTGEGFTPQGMFLKEKLEINPAHIHEVAKIIEIGVLCNNADLHHKEDAWHIQGESTEGALVVMAKKAGIAKEEIHEKYPRILEHPFDADRKCMSAVHRGENTDVAYAKGAPERILERSTFYLEDGQIKELHDEQRALILEKNRAYAEQGFRVLGLAYKEHNSDEHELHHVEKDLVFVGLVSIRDPPEPSALTAIKHCEEAGIRVVMITGDNPLTAKAIANELGIIKKHQRVLTGDELDALSDDEFFAVVDDVAVFARVTPAHKLRIVTALQDNGHIVAMTGDGVNDAPALKKSDIGIAMGLCGTEVAKEASEMIIKDDNFATIVDAVKEGRTIYNNIQKFIYYLLPGNFSQVILVFVATLVGFLPPLTPLLILFINVVTSDIPALGLTLEKPSSSIMQQNPRNPREGILNNYVLLKISQVVPLIVLGAIALFLWELSFKQVDLATAQTVAFATIITFQLFHIFNAKSFNRSIFSKDFLHNKVLFISFVLSLGAMLAAIYLPAMQAIFKTVPLSADHWLPIFAVGASVLFFVEIQKAIIETEIKEYDNMIIHPTRR